MKLNIETSMERELKLISMEAKGAMGLGESANPSRFPTLVEAIKVHATKPFEAVSSIVVGLVTPRDFTDTIGKVKYTSLMDTHLIRPEGMVGNYVTTIDALEKLGKDLVNIEKRLLDPVTKWLGTLINDPKQLEKLSISDAGELIDIELHEKAMASVFSDSDGGASVKYSELVTHNGEWRDVVIRSTKLMEEFNKLDLTDIKTKVMDITELADILAKRFSNDGYKVSGKVLGALSSHIYHVAREVELLGIYGYRVKVVNSSLDANVKRLEEIVS
jgi:hypothetical protein